MGRLADQLREFLAALRQALTAPDTNRAAGTDIARFVALLDGVDVHGGAPSLVPPTRLPVGYHWSAALGATDATGKSLGDSLGRLESRLAWTQNPNYQRRPPTVDFLANYGYAAIVGPAGAGAVLVVDPRLALGVLLLGPGVEYPAHRHPATELYVPLTPAAWQRGEQPWRPEPPGTIIHHPSNVPHAMRAGTDPLLAVYLWHGDLATHARIVN